jgi:hypothetical protein
MTNVLDALLDSWDRNNVITTNLLRLVPDDAMELTPADGSPSIGQLFTHLHYCGSCSRSKMRRSLRGRC